MARGRVAAAAAAMRGKKGVPQIPHPSPPEDLTSEQEEVWWAVVRRLPSDWFPRETQHLLVQYCRTVILARVSQAALDRIESDPEFDLVNGPGKLIQKWHKIEAVARAQTQLINQLSTKLRIAPSSTKTNSIKRPLVVPDPSELWDDAADGDDDEGRLSS